MLFLIKYLLDLPPNNKNRGVPLAITCEKLKEESFSVSVLQAYTLRKVTSTVEMIRETVI